MLAEGACASRADLACKLRVSRARVTQVLGLLDLAPEVAQATLALSDPLPRPIVSERMLRRLLSMPAGEQKRPMEGMCSVAVARQLDVRAVAPGHCV